MKLLRNMITILLQFVIYVVFLVYLLVLYNLFENKEKFLTYYLTHDFISYKENYYKNNKEFDSLNYIDKSIDIFVTCAKYNQMKGLKVTVVGDAKQVRNGLSAIYEGYMAGYNA